MNAGRNLRNTSLAVVIAAAYTVLTVTLGPLGYSWLQVRIGEALTPLPYILGLPAVTGLTLGAFISNAFSPVGLPDIIFGPVLTLISAGLSWKLNLGNKLLACLYPVAINALGVSAYVAGFYGVPYALSVISIGAGELVAAVVIGYPLLVAVQKVLTRDLGGS